MNYHFRFHLLFNILRGLPKKFRVQYEDMQQPFFIIGSGRNGSTMLNLMLNQHTQLHLHSEQYFLGPSILKFHYYNYGLWRDMVKIIAGELVTSGKSHTWSVDSLPDFQELYLLPHHKKRLQYLLDVMFRNGTDCQVWGDTTPLNAYYIEEIFHTFPKAKYFFLVRDGRDVVASYKHGGVKLLGDLSIPINASKHWMHSLHKYDWLKKRTDVSVLRYEQLVTRPEQVLEGICGKLGMAFEEQMLAFNKHVPDREMYDLKVHENLKKPLFDSSIGAFNNRLTSQEQDLCLPVLMKGLQKFGYL